MYNFASAAEGTAEVDDTALVGDRLESRPRKLRRTDNLRNRRPSVIERGLSSEYYPAAVERGNIRNDGELQTHTAAHTRGVTACQRCRVRKSRCDNQRPSCSNCSKFRASCVYESEVQSSSCNVFGPQILNAIGGLATLLQSQHTESNCQHCQKEKPDTLSPSSLPSPDFARSPPSQFTLRQAWASPQSGNDDVFSKSSVPLNEERAPQRQKSLRQSLESVLDWKVYSSKMTFRDPIGENGNAITPIHLLPTLEYSELVRLELKYIDGVHIKNPILDLPKLHEMILQVSENGLDWSTRTCLVALVCAIGAVSERYKDQPQPVNLSSPSGRQYRLIGTTESEPELALPYWNIAAKRLGYAIGQNDLEAVQCLCLAGIWHMFQLQPLQAWKYFSLAGTAWYAATLKDVPSPILANDTIRNKSLSQEQSLYFTIYKSYCELRLELDIPGSVLEDTELSQTFPLPPSPDSQLSDTESDVTERGWYYYLAEIAARHLINRLLHARSWTQAVTSNRDAWRLITEVELFETQLQEWHSSLPPMFKFEIPQGPTIGPHPDELVQILRHRYLTSRELIYRPFVRLCVENSLECLEPDLRNTIAVFASTGLQYCMYKLTQISPQRHQGTWFMMRIHATNAAILNAASMASKDATLLGAALMAMPSGWRERVEDMMRQIKPYWDDSCGDVAEIRRAVEWALSVGDS